MCAEKRVSLWTKKKKVYVLDLLTRKHEAEYISYAKRGDHTPAAVWSVHDMDAEKRKKMLAQITVIEISMTHITGTVKMGQNGSVADRESSADVLLHADTDDALLVGRLMKLTVTENNIAPHVLRLDQIIKSKKDHLAKKERITGICIGALLGVLLSPLLTWALRRK